MGTYILSAILALATAAAFAQNAVGVKASPQSAQSNEATAAGESSANQTKCDIAEDQDIPITSTIEATVTGSLDSTHLKPGREITARVVTGWQFPRCNLPAKSTLYGHITATSSSKNPECSARIISTKHNFRLESGSELILTMEEVPE